MFELNRFEKDVLDECIRDYIHLLSEKISDTVCYNKDCREIFSEKLQNISVLRDKIFKD